MASLRFAMLEETTNERVYGGENFPRIVPAVGGCRGGLCRQDAVARFAGNGYAHSESGLSAAITTSGVEAVGMNSHPCQNMEEYTVEAGSPEAAALREILGRYAYHPCRDSLTGETGIQDISNATEKKAASFSDAAFVVS